MTKTILNNLQRISIAAAAVLFLICAGAAAAEQGAPAAEGKRVAILKVMTINLRHNKDFWEERFPLIADEIVRLKPDLIGLQEMKIDIEQSKTLLAMIEQRGGADGYKYAKYEHVKTGGYMIQGEGVSIFSRFPIEKKGYADLKEGRPAVFTRVNVADGLTVDFYNTHLHNQGGDEVRLAQAKILVEYMNKNYAGFPAFLTGDMNSNDATGTIAYFIANSLIDSYRAFHGAETAAAGNTSPVIISKDNAQQDFANRIDYVFVKPPAGWQDRIKIVDSVVCFKNYDANGLYPSDHLGVMTTFEISY